MLIDLGYLSKELKEELAERGYKLWTPVRRNMKGTKQWNDSKIAALRRTIETRFSKLCRKLVDKALGIDNDIIYQSI